MKGQASKQTEHADRLREELMELKQLLIQAEEKAMDEALHKAKEIA